MANTIKFQFFFMALKFIFLKSLERLFERRKNLPKNYVKHFFPGDTEIYDMFGNWNLLRVKLTVVNLEIDVKSPYFNVLTSIHTQKCSLSNFCFLIFCCNFRLITTTTNATRSNKKVSHKKLFTWKITWESGEKEG